MSARYAIVVAGGSGQRMGTTIPKQFLPLGDSVVLLYTLRLFEMVCREIILVLPQEQIVYWGELCRQYRDVPVHSVCAGGATRFDSVVNGLAALRATEGVVAIHDGVRPLASVELIERCFVTSELHGAALPYIAVTDSLRHRESSGSTAVDRAEYIAVQTPQTFDLFRLREAYRQPYQECFTDDASVWEASGGDSIALVEGEDSNIKITTPKDLYLAECLLSQR